MSNLNSELNSNLLSKLNSIKERKIIMQESKLNKSKEKTQKQSVAKSAKSSKSTTANSEKSKSRGKEDKEDKEEKKSELNNLNLVEDETNRKWGDSKNKILKKGPFTEEEANLVFDTICDYITENNKSIDDILSYITEKQKKTDSPLWTIIAEKFPERSVQSIHNFCHRALHPMNHKGEWKESEIEKLIFYVKEKGSKWVEIAELLERTPTNCKDKYKELGGAHFAERIKKFDLLTSLKLFKYINELMPDFEILKYQYIFKDDVKDLFSIDAEEHKLFIDKSLKDERTEIIIFNMLRLALNFDELEKMLASGEEIMFTTLAEKIKTKSYDDIKNYWNKILNELGLSRKIKLKLDLKMIKQVLKHEYIEKFEEIDFSIIKNGRADNENRERLQELLRNIDIYGVGEFRDLCEKLVINLKSEYLLLTKKSDITQEFYDEVKSKKKVNLKDYYTEYLKKKRTNNKIIENINKGDEKDNDSFFSDLYDEIKEKKKIPSKNIISKLNENSD